MRMDCFNIFPLLSWALNYTHFHAEWFYEAYYFTGMLKLKVARWKYTGKSILKLLFFLPQNKQLFSFM